MTNSLLLETFRNNLPQKPYCTDELTFGLKIRPAETAIKKRYLQYNKPTDLRWFVYDVDRPTAHFDWYDCKAPSPNITVMNRQNGHAHLFYGLEVPVYTQTTAKKNPIRFASSIDVALIKALEADEHFAELICKNPFNEFWETRVWREASYDLAELADSLDLSAYKDQRKRLPEIGLGRNCDLFDSTRFYAYREIRKPIPNYLFDEFYLEDDFVDRCISYARNHNLFNTPLPEREILSIGKSVGKWVYRNMSPEGFLEWAESRRKKSIEVRQEQSDEKKNEVLALAAQGLSKQAIAIYLGISKRQIMYYFSS
jgi:hypothetical protein